MDVPATIHAEVLDPTTRAHARRVMAAILAVIRAHKQHRPVAAALQDGLDQLAPKLYLWHWFAWKLGGFKKAVVDLAATPDGKVVVIGATEILYGDPMTEEVAAIPVAALTVTQILPQPPADLAQELADLDAALHEAEAAENPPADLLVVTPKSAYRFH